MKKRERTGRKSWRAALGLALGVGVSAGDALAQSQAQDAEIVVTATRRATALQDVPVSVTPVTAQMVENAGVRDIQDLTSIVPSLQFNVSENESSATARLRGIGTQGSNPGLESSVGVFIDGVYRARNGVALSDIGEVQQIEVLRGPQGALYGRNVTGGAVLVRTRAPSDVFEARARLAAETGPNLIGEVAISGPLAPGVLSGRLAIYHADDRGWLENGFDGARFGENETSIYRAALRFTPTSTLEFLLRAEQGFVDGDGPAGQNHALFERGSFDFAINNRGYAATDWEQVTLETNWDVAFGDGVITNIAGWRAVEVPWSADIDSSPAFTFHTRVLNTQEQWSEELRYACLLYTSPSPRD